MALHAEDGGQIAASVGVKRKWRVPSAGLVTHGHRPYAREVCVQVASRDGPLWQSCEREHGNHSSVGIHTAVIPIGLSGNSRGNYGNTFDVFVLFMEGNRAKRENVLSIWAEKCVNGQQAATEDGRRSVT